ncbi:MAG: nitronate monooxygenase, partial [Deltaproteobacteria bacterium]|nr:nitronate monooxygenase [Deltaproteobacteria bacterium]
DVEGGILFAGQCCGGIKDVPTVKELIDRTIAEAETALGKLNTLKV